MKHRLGDLIFLSEAKNRDLGCNLSNLKGISIKKIFIQTKADMKDICPILIKGSLEEARA